MKYLLFCLFFGLSLSLASQTKTILLQDGSSLMGEIVGKDSVFGKSTIRLSDGTEIILPDSLIVFQQEKGQASYFIANEGRKQFKKGTYTMFAFHSLAAKNSEGYLRKNRWDLGIGFSKGYQFNPYMAVGGGIGLDAYGEFLMPIFAEMRGCLLSTQYRQTVNKPDMGYRFPICYSLQVGYNLPVDAIFLKDEPVKTKGGILIYPSMGLQFATRNGANLVFDIGYKIQRFDRVLKDWWGSTYRDKISMRSLAIRMGVLF